MLGMGWFPETLGGLDRYYRSLLEHLPEARGVVIGPAGDAPPSVRVVAAQDSPLPKRLLSYWLAARRASESAEVVDSHFALYAAAPLLSGSLRGQPKVFHFQGPWAQENVAAGDGSRIRFVLRRALERRVLRGADAHIVLSSAFRRVIVEDYRVVPWDVNVWAPRASAMLNDPDSSVRSHALWALGFGAGELISQAHLQRTPRDVRAVLAKLLQGREGSGLGVQGSAKAGSGHGRLS